VDVLFGTSNVAPPLNGDPEIELRGPAQPAVSARESSRRRSSRRGRYGVDEALAHRRTRYYDQAKELA